MGVSAFEEVNKLCTRNLISLHERGVFLYRKGKTENANAEMGSDLVPDHEDIKMFADGFRFLTGSAGMRDIGLYSTC